MDHRSKKWNSSVVLTNLKYFIPTQLEYPADSCNDNSSKDSCGYVKDDVQNGAQQLSDSETSPGTNTLASASAKQKRPKTGWKAYIGLFFALIAAIVFAVASLLVKLLGKRYHAFNVALWKYQGMVIVGPFLAAYYRSFKKEKIFDPLWPPNNKPRAKTFCFILIRGTLGTMTLILTIMSLSYMKLADSTVIRMSSPIAVTILARICLGEPCGIIPIGAAILTLIGVCILTRPPLLTGGESFDSNTLIGTGISIVVMLLLSSIFLILRYLRTVHYSVFIFCYGYIGGIESLLLALGFGVLDIPKTTNDWIITGICAVLGVLGQLSITLALKYEHAGPVALVRTSEIVFSFVLQFIFLGVTPDWFSLVGGGIVMISLVFTTLRKWVTVLPEDHPSRIKYRFLLL